MRKSPKAEWLKLTGALLLYALLILVPAAAGMITDKRPLNVTSRL